MIILHIETSTNVCSIAISENGKCIFSKANFDGMSHASLLSVFISEAFDELKKTSKVINAIAVSSGPGSYTGLRIGVSTAKGLCFGLDIPLIAVSTLEVLTTSALSNANISNNALFCPMIDARRMEVYDALYNANGEIIREIRADIIDDNSFKEYLLNNSIYFFGNGAEKCKSTLTHSNAHFINNLNPLAENMIPLAEKAFLKKEFVDVAYFEPFYLKEFYTTAKKIE